MLFFLSKKTQLGIFIDTLAISALKSTSERHVEILEKLPRCHLFTVPAKKLLIEKFKKENTAYFIS